MVVTTVNYNKRKKIIMNIEIKKADITNLKDIQDLNHRLFELEFNNFDPFIRSFKGDAYDRNLN